MKMTQHEQYLIKRINAKASISQLEAFPTYFEIETVHDCNARCKICPAMKHSRPKQVMDQALFEKIIREIAQQREHVRAVKLFRDGEPLLDPHLAERVRLCKDLGIKEVSITSNMSLTGADRAEQLLQAGLDIIDMSVDGFSSATFESIRCGLKYEEVLHNVLQFVRLRDAMRSPCIIRVRMVLQEENAHEWEDFRMFWRRALGEQDMVMHHPIHNWGNQLSTFRPARESVQRLVPCVALWSLMPIFADGTVPLCNVDYKASFGLGRVTEQSIADIWRGKIANDYRKLHIHDQKSHIPLCAECNAWDEPKYDE